MQHLVELIPLSHVPRLLPPQANGRPVSTATLYRWTSAGLAGPDGRRVRLETTRIGGTLYVAPSALEAFVAALSGRAAPAAPRTTTTRRRAIERADAVMANARVT